MKKITTLNVIVTLCCVLLTSCTSTLKPGDYDASEVGKINKVVPGVIISKRAVKIHSKAVENSVSLTANNPSVGTASTPASDVVVNHPHGFEYVIRLNSGAIISVVQDEDLKLKVKQHILVVYGPTTRVLADDGSDDY